MQSSSGASTKDFTLIRRGFYWLLLLAPLFYASYGLANWLAAQRAFVPEITFAWEQHIPFLGWTIIPYWSLNLFYAIAVVTCPNIQAQNRLVGRYLTAQCIAVLCFIAFPLTITWVKPEVSGISGWLFVQLGNFDQPFNQAPSLHIALTIIIWDQLRRLLPDWLLPLWHGWCLLIGLSVLTTWQHHFVDIPSGALLGLFALWLFPHAFSAPWQNFCLTSLKRSIKLALTYAGASIGLLILVVDSTYPVMLFLLWPALAFLLLSFGYTGAGVKIFQKKPDGSVSLAAFWLFMPLRPLLWFNRILWTWREPVVVEIKQGIFLGRFPRRKEAERYATIIDMTGEFIAPKYHKTTWLAFPSLDLTPPDITCVHNAVAALEQAQKPVLVCCALGLQRSANVIATWLVLSGQAVDRQQAIAFIRQTGRPIRLSSTHQ